MTAPMPHSEVERKVKEILARKLDRKLEDIHGHSRLTEDLGVDSFGTVELMFEIEEAFSLEIADSDLETVRTVDDIVTYLQHWLDTHAKP
jgi:acyl carrier protein